jgi:hypothetical protein
MGSSLSPIASITYMEHFEKVALDTAQQSLWLRHTDIFMVWPNGPERFQNYFIHLRSFRLSIKFTMEQGQIVQFLFWMFWSSR